MVLQSSLQGCWYHAIRPRSPDAMQIQVATHTSPRKQSVTIPKAAGQASVCCVTTFCSTDNLQHVGEEEHHACTVRHISSSIWVTISIELACQRHWCMHCLSANPCRNQPATRVVLNHAVSVQARQANGGQDAKNDPPRGLARTALPTPYPGCPIIILIPASVRESCTVSLPCTV